MWQSHRPGCDRACGSKQEWCPSGARVVLAGDAESRLGLLGVAWRYRWPQVLLFALGTTGRTLLGGLRRPEALARILAGSPFSDAAAERPGRLLVHFLAREPRAGKAAALARYDGPERVVIAGRERYIDDIDRVGTSRLSPARPTRRLGQPGTAALEHGAPAAPRHR